MEDVGFFSDYCFRDYFYAFALNFLYERQKVILFHSRHVRRRHRQRHLLRDGER